MPISRDQAHSIREDPPQRVQFEVATRGSAPLVVEETADDRGSPSRHSIATSDSGRPGEARGDELRAVPRFGFGRAEALLALAADDRDERREHDRIER